MDIFKNSIICLVAAILIASCSSFQKKEEVKNGSIFIRSVLDEDVCYLTINDSLYLFKRRIITDRSFGVDKINWIELKMVKNPIKINVSFEGDIISGERSFDPVIRRIELDTVFDLRKGKNLIIEAGVEKIELGYSAKRINLN